MSVIGTRLPVDSDPYQGIVLEPIAEELGLPPTVGTPMGYSLKIEDTVLAISQDYRLYPNCRNMTTPKATFYTAYNRKAQRTEYVVGPNDVDAFANNLGLYMTAAGNFFGFLGSPSRYEVISGTASYLFAIGHFRDGFRMLGRAWLEALQDPNWWMQTLMTAESMSAPKPTSGLTRAAEDLERNPIRAPTVREPAGAVRGGARPIAPSAAGEPSLARVEPKVTEPAFLPEMEDGPPRGPSSNPAEIAQNLARGNLGERLAADALHADGHTILSYKPDIAGTNQGGIDIVTLKNNKVYFIDNKALTRAGNVSNVSALTTNFDKNMATVRTDFSRFAADTTRSAAERDLFQNAVRSIDSGSYIRAVTNANVAPDTKILSGVSQQLKNQGIEFINVMRKP
jgi:Holliday junction resolvase-like predicted endonuclease